MLFSCLQMIQKEYGINTQRIGRMKIVTEISRPIDSPNKLKIGSDSRILLRRQNKISLT